MTFKVTHVDAQQHRHQVLLTACSRSAAEAVAEVMYGAAVYLAAICVRGGR